METTFGCVMGFALGLGLWLNRKPIVRGNTGDDVSIPATLEWILIVIHGCLLYLWGVSRNESIEFIAGYPLGMGLVPVICIMGGRYWPYMFSLALVAFPIAGITLKTTDNVHYYAD